MTLATKNNDVYTSSRNLQRALQLDTFGSREELLAAASKWLARKQLSAWFFFPLRAAKRVCSKILRGIKP
jgi:hypothetical protein